MVRPWCPLLAASLPWCPTRHRDSTAHIGHHEDGKVINSCSHSRRHAPVANENEENDEIAEPLLNTGIRLRHPVRWHRLSCKPGLDCRACRPVPATSNAYAEYRSQRVELVFSYATAFERPSKPARETSAKTLRSPLRASPLRQDCIPLTSRVVESLLLDMERHSRETRRLEKLLFGLRQHTDHVVMISVTFHCQSAVDHTEENDTFPFGRATAQRNHVMFKNRCESG